MTNKIHISVAIVTYQNESEITACLLSLLENLKDFDYQIVVIDNNSRDGTRQRLQSFQDNKSFHIIFNEDNPGFTRALNMGLCESSMDFILVLNPDIVLKPGCLDGLINTLVERADVGVVAPQLLNTDGSVQPSCRRFPRRRDIVFNILGLSFLFRKSKLFNGWKMGDFDHRSRQKVDQPQGAFLLFKKTVLKKIGLWDERFPMFFSDVDWCRRVKEHGFEIVFEPSAKAIHHKGASVLKARTKMILSSHLSFYQYLKKYQKNPVLVNEIFGLLLMISAVIRMIATLLFRRVAK